MIHDRSHPVVVLKLHWIVLSTACRAVKSIVVRLGFRSLQLFAVLVAARLRLTRAHF